MFSWQRKASPLSIAYTIPYLTNGNTKYFYSKFYITFHMSYLTNGNIQSNLY